MVNEVTIRIGGESGEGTISGGDILALAAARWGYHVYTFRTFPAEILGGPCLFQVRISDQTVKSMGDYPDVLVCLNQEAYDRNIGDLRHGGVLIYDPSDLTPEAGDFISYAIPFNEIARKEVQLYQTKNMVMLGAISGLFGPPVEAIAQVVESKLSRSRKSNPILMEKNMLALEIAKKYATELPQVGGTFMQAEDEIAALAAVLGASFTGVRSMTATSGPGFSLMTELIGYASMAEIPAVIIDAQRAGPSTGMPTKMEQSDLSFALNAGHGDTPRMIVAPADVADCYSLMILAFEMAERYQMPVIFLSDQSLTARVESVDRSVFKPAEIQERLQFNGNGKNGASPLSETVTVGVEATEHSYGRYAYTASGISPISAPGAGAYTYVATGLEHDDHGHPNYEPENHIAMMEKRYRKLATAAEELPKSQRDRDQDGTSCIIGWGSTEGTIQEAVDRVRAYGYKVAALHPKILSPLPDRAIRDFIRSVKTVIVPECNYSGQLANLLGAKYGLQAIRVNKFGGIPFTAGEILRAIEEVS